MNRTLPRPPAVVDLHAEAFLSDWEDYDTHELLDLSIAYFRDMLDAAIYWEYNSIQFIHGRGKGILKKEIYEELKFYKQDGLIVSYKPSYRNEDVVIVEIGL